MRSKTFILPKFFWGFPIFLVLVLFSNVALTSQNLNFLNYQNSHIWYNPASTGLLFNSDVLFSGTQNFQEISGLTNYKTSSVSIDGRLLFNKLQSSWLGVGGNVIYDKIGNGKISTIQYLLPFAYHQVINTKHVISFGASAAWTSRNLDYTGFLFGDQWDGEGFNLPTNDVSYTPNKKYWNLQVGLMWTSFPNDNFNYSVGISTDYLNTPTDRFSPNAISTKSTSNQFQLPSTLKASIQTSYTPKYSSLTFLNDLYTTYHNNELTNTIISAIEYNVLGENNYLLNSRNSVTLYLGLGSRIGSSGIIALGIGYKSIKVYLNYEGKFSSLKNSFDYNNLLEISFFKNLNFKRSKRKKNNKVIHCATRF